MICLCFTQCCTTLNLIIMRGFCILVLHLIWCCTNQHNLGALNKAEIWLLSNLWYKVHQIPRLKCFSSYLAVVIAQSIEARCEIENEDLVGAVLTGDAPTTSAWSTISLPTEVWLKLEVWQQFSQTAHAQIAHSESKKKKENPVINKKCTWSPSPEPMLTHHERCSVAFTWEQLHKMRSWNWSITCFGNYTFIFTTTSLRVKWVKVFYAMIWFKQIYFTTIWYQLYNYYPFLCYELWKSVSMCQTFFSKIKFEAVEFIFIWFKELLKKYFPVISLFANKTGASLH